MATDSEKRVGRLVGGKYRVIRWIADGGMGSVYEAENEWTQRRVALKLLREKPGRRSRHKKQHLARMLREARTATRIEHPNVVGILDMGSDPADGSVYLVQELLEGSDLRRRLDREPQRRLREGEALAILVPIMEALEAAHQLGVIHRDVKPSNIFLARTSGGAVIPKLIDFGLAKLGNDTTLHTTGEGMIVGTPYYMSPEQARGERVDPRTDVWSVGAVLFESLTGRLPFIAETLPLLLVRIGTEKPPSVRSVNPDVPVEVANVVDHALAVSRDARTPTMTELLADVRATSVYEDRVSAWSSSRIGPVRGRLLRAAPPSGQYIAVPESPLPEEEAEPTATFDTDLSRLRGGIPRASQVPPVEIVEVETALPERLSWRPSPAQEREARAPEPAPMPQALRSSSASSKQGSRPLRFAVCTEEPDLHELGDVTTRHLSFRKFVGYAELVDALAEGDVDLAWLPPVAYVRAARVGAARLILTLERDGRRSYSAAIVARRDEAQGLDYLAGRRAAWVDPWSAAGYLVPRAMLRETGMNPDALLHGQSFYGSYGAVVSALLDRQADVGAMYCLLDERQRIVRDAWDTHPELVAIAISAEPIPGDTITAAAGVSESRLRRGVAALLRVGGTERGRHLLRRVFGTDRFVVGNPSRYQGLELALAADTRREK